MIYKALQNNDLISWQLKASCIVFMGKSIYAFEREHKNPTDT